MLYKEHATTQTPHCPKDSNNTSAAVGGWAPESEKESVSDLTRFGTHNKKVRSTILPKLSTFVPIAEKGPPH